MLNHEANDGFLNFAVVQVHADFVADLELSVVWLATVDGGGAQNGVRSKPRAD